MKKQIFLFCCLSIIVFALPVIAGEGQSNLSVDGAFFNGFTENGARNTLSPSLKVEPGMSNVSVIELDPLPENTLQSIVDEESLPQRIGISRDINQLASEDMISSVLSWSPLSGGGHVGGVQIISPSAAAVRIGIKVEKLPEEAELRFYEASNQIDPGKSLVVTGEHILNILDLNQNAEPDNPDSAIYWSPTIEGGAVGLEIYLPSGLDTNEVKITIPYLSHMAVSPFSSSNTSPVLQGYGDSNPCQNDATCHSSWLNMRRATAKMLFTASGGSYICTGTMLNDIDTTTAIPYFISANHCISTQAVASTLETHWFFESATCNSSSLSSSYQVKSGGATLLWTEGMTSTQNDSSKDTSFFRLNDSAPSGIYFAGWNADPMPSGGKTGVHHPEGDWKKISFGSYATMYSCWSTGDGSFSCKPSANGSFAFINWADGGTEGGSSGSGIFHNNDQLIGDLTGGSGSCGGSTSDPDFAVRTARSARCQSAVGNRPVCVCCCGARPRESGSGSVDRGLRWSLRPHDHSRSCQPAGRGWTVAASSGNDRHHR